MIGIGWPTVLPRLLSMASGSVGDEEQDDEEKMPCTWSKAEGARSLLIFETSKQHTWIVATGDRLYFVLDDVRRPAPRIARSVGRSELTTRADGAIAVDTQSKSLRTGLVDVGRRRRGWFYSKALFPSSRPIDRAIDNLHAVDGGTPSREMLEREARAGA